LSSPLPGDIETPSLRTWALSYDNAQGYFWTLFRNLIKNRRNKIMAKSHRDFQKRRLGYILNCLEKAMEHTLELKAEFDAILGIDPLEDEYLDTLVLLAEASSHAKFALLLHNGLLQTNQAQTIYSQFALHAWGAVPDQISKWTNTGQDYIESKKP